MVLCLTAGAAVAGETTDSGHTGFVPVAGENVPLATGGVMQRMTVSGICMAEDAASPLHGTSVMCGGVIVVAADGTAQAGGGSCHFINTGGDVAIGWWKQESAEGGAWGLMGGTGKFEGIKGKGSFINNPPLADGTFVNDWEITWKIE
jgi:hypothetical protein